MNSQIRKLFLRKLLSHFYGGYFLWPYSLQREPNYPFSDSTEIRLANSSTTYSSHSVSGSHISQSSFSKNFFSVFNWGYILFQHSPLWGFQISLCKFHKNSLTKRLLKGKAVTLWGELPEHKAVSQKASFQFWTEDISFFTIALYGLPNIPLPIPQEQP